MVKSGIQRKIVKGKVTIRGGKKVSSKKRGSSSKGFTTTTYEAELQKKAATGDVKAKEDLSRFRSSKSTKGSGIAQTAADTTKTTVQITDTRAGTRTTTTGRLKSEPLRRTETLRQYKEMSISGIAPLLSESQRKQVIGSFQKSNVSRKDLITVKEQLKAIDRQKNTTFLQKEEQKRILLGISSASPANQGFFRKPSPTEAVETLNTIKPTSFNSNGKLDLGYQGLSKFNNWLEQKRQKAIRNDKNAQAAIIGTASLPTNFVQSYANILIAIAGLIKNPAQTVVALSQLTRKDIRDAGASLGVRVQAGQPSVITDIAAEIITQKYGLGLIKGARQAQKLRPSFVKATGETFVIKKNQFKSVKEFLTGENKNISKIFARDPEIILKKQTVKSGATPLSEQAKLAGKVVTAVNASADQLTTWLKRKQIIRKPIPGETDFPIRIKNVLDKFDNGRKLTRKEFANINKWLQKNVAPNTTLLERSLYADPASGLRITRLGISKAKTATLKDILRGNFKLLGNKPQVLIFQNAKVAKFPKSLKDVEKKLKAGKKLTEAETNRLIEWQVKTGSGKFKPVGSTIYKGGIELEVTLAPGELIKRIKQVGFTFIEGKKVTFVTAETYKPTKALVDKIKKAKSGKLTDKQVSLLEKDLSKKLGKKVKIETPTSKTRARTRTDLPVLRIDGKFLRVLRVRARAKPVTRTRTTAKRVTKKRVTTPRITPRTSIKRVKPKTPKTKRVTTPRPSTPRAPRAPAKTVRAPTPRAPRAPAKVARSPVRKIPRLSFDNKNFENKVLTFEGTFRERKNKLKPAGKNNPVITKTIKIRDTKNRALKKVIARVDNTLVRSLQLRVVGIGQSKKDINIPTAIKKFRVKKSTNTPILKLVEKSKNAFDRPSEKREAKLARKRKSTTKRKK